jgi:DnaJ-class molecular chaperone
MGVLCVTCQGSGRSIGMTAVTQAHHAGTACSTCEGRGYRSDHRRATTQPEDLEVGKVLAYDASMGAAKVYLEETLHQGDRLLVLAQGIMIEFVVDTILVANMRLSMALKGWEVTLLVPQALQTGAWIMRR